MISFFRNFFKSKIGLPVFIGFLILIALAFASADISGTANLGGLAGDEKVAVVGDNEVTTEEMQSAMNTALRRERPQNQTITMPQFVAAGGLEGELDRLIDRYAISQFAKEYGLRGGENLVNSEILQISAFRNLTGDFDDNTYQAALRQQGLTDAMLRGDISDSLLAEQLMRPALAAPQMPEAAARQYAALVLERRQGQIALIPSAEYAPDRQPSDDELATFYAENSENYILPERRTLRFAAFGPNNVSTNLTPSAEQIAARYEENAEFYQASESRAISSFVVPTQAAAAALVERIRGGVSLDNAAQEANFQISRGELLALSDMASSTSPEFAQNVFAAEQGAVIEPERGALGWYVAQLDNIERIPARSLAEVSDTIALQLQQEARAGALIELSSQIEELVDTGTSLSDVATQFELEVSVVPDVLADGRLFGGLGQGISPALRPILETSFQMDEGRPQLAELVAGTQFLIFDVESIVESAPPPIDEVREQIELAWSLDEGAKEARLAANRILEAVSSGTGLNEAMRAENAALSQVQDINLRRAELFADQNQRIPAPIVLLFSMARGSTKVLEDANSLGWYIVDLGTIESDSLDDAPELLANTRASLAPALVGEYNAQLTRAIRNAVGVERNDEALEALRESLVGQF